MGWRQGRLSASVFSDDPDLLSGRVLRGYGMTVFVAVGDRAACLAERNDDEPQGTRYETGAYLPTLIPGYLNCLSCVS